MFTLALESLDFLYEGLRPKASDPPCATMLNDAPLPWRLVGRGACLCNAVTKGSEWRLRVLKGTLVTCKTSMSPLVAHGIVEHNAIPDVRSRPGILIEMSKDEITVQSLQQETAHPSLVSFTRNIKAIAEAIPRST